MCLNCLSLLACVLFLILQGFNRKKTHRFLTTRASISLKQNPSTTYSITMQHTIKLTYFKAPGRAAPIRHALAIAGVPFEDIHVDFADLPSLQQSGSLPFRSLPIMTVDGKTFAESSAMLRFAGKLGGLYPTDAVEAMQVDMVVDALEPIVTAIFSDKSEEARKKVQEETFPRYFGAVDKMYAETEGKGPYLLGETLTIADLKVAAFAKDVNKGGKIDHVPAGCLEKFEHVMKCAKAVGEVKKVKEWNEAHPEE